MQKLVASVNSRSHQYFALSAEYLTLLSSSVDGYVSAVSDCMQLAERLLDSSRQLEAAMEAGSEIEEQIRVTKERVQQLESQVHTALHSP